MMQDKASRPGIEGWWCTKQAVSLIPGDGIFVSLQFKAILKDEHHRRGTLRNFQMVFKAGKVNHDNKQSKKDSAM